MAQMVPWYYKLYWKMEGWLASKAHKSSNSDRGFFGKMLSDTGNSSRNISDRLNSRLAVGGKAFSHQKPMHNTIYLALPVEKKPGTNFPRNLSAV